MTNPFTEALRASNAVEPEPIAVIPESVQPEVVAPEPVVAEPEPAAPTADNPFSSALRANRASNDSILGASLRLAADQKPEQAAEAQRLSAQTGLPVDVVGRNLDDVRAKLTAQEREVVLRQAPHLREFLIDPSNAAVAHEDVDNLSAFETYASALKSAAQFSPLGFVPRLAKAFYDDPEDTTRALKNVGRAGVAGIRYDLPAGVTGLMAAGAELLNSADARRQGLYQAPPNSTLAKFGNRLLEESKSIRLDATDYMGDQTGAGFVERGVASGVRSVGAMVLPATISFLTGNPAPMLSIMGAQTFGQGYEQGRTAGLTSEQAGRFGFEQGSIEVVTELFPALTLFKNLKLGSPVFRTMLQNQAQEQVGEQVATAAQDFNEFISLPENKDKVIEDYLKERPGAAGQTFIATLVASGAISGALAGVEKYADHLSTKAQKQDQIRLQQEQAKSSAATFASLDQAADAAKTKELAPAKFEQYAERVLDAQNQRTVYLPLEVFETYYQSKEVDPSEVWQTLTGSTEGYVEAVSAGTDLAVPYAAYLAHLTPEERAKFTPHLKASPDALSAAELESPEIQRQLDELTAGAAQETDEKAAAAATPPTSSEQVYQTVYEQVKGTGIYDDAAAKTIARLAQQKYETRAARRGLQETPEQALAMTGLEITNERQAAGTLAGRFTDATLDPLIDDLRSGQRALPAAVHGPTLTEFLRERGIQDFAGELAVMDPDKGLKPFQRKLLNPEGRTLDEAYAAAVEAGYLPEADADAPTKHGINDLLEALDADLRGSPIYSDRNRDETLYGREQQLAALDEELGRRGIDLKSATNEQVKAALRDEQSFQQMEASVSGDALSIERNDQTAALHSQMQSTLLNAQKISDVVISEPFASQGYGALKRPARLEVLKAMLGLVGENEQIADSIIELVPVDVVNGLFGSKLAAKMALHDESMLKDRLAVDAELSVTSGSDAADAIGLFVKHVARVATENLVPPVALDSRLKSTEGGTALVTDSGLSFSQGRGSKVKARIDFLKSGGKRIVLTEHSTLDSILHEFGHLWLDELIVDAMTPGTPDQLRTDLDTLLAHFELDVRSADGEAAVRKAIETKHHELFATSFEAYAREGNAPSESLRAVFAKFKDWFLARYRELQQLIGLGYYKPLNADVRAVFDRLLATDEAIAKATFNQFMGGFGPVLPIEEMRKLGVSESKLKEYAAALDRAKEKLGAKLLGDLMRKSRSEYKAALKAKAREVDAETKQNPAYIAMEVLTTGKWLGEGEMPEGLKGLKLNKDDLVARYGEPYLKRLARTYSVEGGENADLVALKLGYKSATELIETLVNLVPRKEFIKAEAERRMEVEEPDAMLDGSLSERATAALHNSRYGKVLQNELELLGELAKQGVPSAAVIRYAAEKIINGLKVRDLIPQRYLTAERKHANQAQKLAAQGKYAEALVAKRKQALNARLYSEARKAQALVEKTGDLFKRLGKKSGREGLAAGGTGFLTHVEQLAHVFGYRQLSPARVSAWEPIQPFLDELQEEGEITAYGDEVLAAVAQSKVKGNRDIAVSELRQVYEAAANLNHLARQAKKVRKGQELVDREEAVNALVTAAQSSGLPVKPIPLSDRELTDAQLVGQKADKFFTEVLRPENIIEALDGGQTGPWHDFWLQALEKSENNLRGLQNQMGAKLKALRKSLPKDFLDQLEQRIDVPGIGSVRRATVLAMVLNTGNASNLQRLQNGGLAVNGEPVELSADQVQQLRSLLTADELAYVQGLWDAVDSLWPQIVDLQERMAGLPPEKVEAQTFEVRGQTYRGGYWPLAYDPRQSNVGEVQSVDDAMRYLMGAGNSQAFTPKGYQKGRVQKFSAPLKLDFAQILSRHLDQVMTDLTYRETVKHLSSLLRSTRLKRVLLERFGQAGYDSLKGQLAYSVSASSLVAGQAASGWQNITDMLLSNSTVAALGIRPDIALGNAVAGYVQGLDRAGVRGLMRGLRETYANREASTALIKSKSPFMQSELEEWDHAYAQELQWTSGKHGFGPAFRRVMMTLHRWAQNEVSRAVWLGTYLNSIKAGETDAQSVRLADKAIRQTQLSKGRKDLSTFERDPAFKQSRQFMGPMFVQYGRLRESFRGQGNRRDAGARIVGLMLSMFVAPALFALAAGRWAKDGDDDDEIDLGDWAIWLAANTLLYPLQTLPILRDIGSAIESSLTGNPINPRAAPAAQAVVSVVRAGKSMADNIEKYSDGDDLDFFDMSRDLITAAGPLTGIPSSQFRISSKAVEHLMNDGDGNYAGLLIYGAPKPP